MSWRHVKEDLSVYFIIQVHILNFFLVYVDLILSIKILFTMNIQTFCFFKRKVKNKDRKDVTSSNKKENIFNGNIFDKARNVEATE